MPYDKQSFLSGVAVGRNMKSWPAFEGGGLLEFFAFDITIDDEEVLPLEYTSWRCNFPNGGQISWGDGTIETILPTSTLSYLRHVYESIGEYRIVVFGCAGNMILNQSDHRQYLKRVLTPFPSTASITPYRAFSYCTNLESLPLGLFSYATILGRDARYICDHCQRLSDIPGDLFLNIDPTELESAFEAVGYFLTEPVQIPSSLLWNCASLTSVARIFEFANITEIPDALFRDCEALENATNAFSSTKIEAIPENIFAGCPGITNLIETFQSCRYVRGNVPELWISHPNANGTKCFNGVRFADNYNDIPSDWK